MAGEDDPHPSLAGRFGHAHYFASDLRAIFDLLHNSYLHVVDDQGHRRWVTDVFQRLRDVESECAQHEYRLLRERSDFTALPG